MMHIIIAETKEGRERILLEQISKLFEREVSDFIELLKVPDIHYLTTTQNSLGIDEVKKFVQAMVYQPFEEKYQVGIIDKADILTPEAQNALLKTFEDSNEKTMFFLLVSREGNLLDTILSRGSKYYGQSVGNAFESEDVTKFLEMDTVKRLSFVEKMGKDKERDYIVNFLNALLAYYKYEFEKEIEEGKSGEESMIVIQEIQEAIGAIKGNVSKKLALYNMVVQMV
ncbi:MAG: hypothetical protein UT34_C0001G0267 [candidate division WS6 bacterium GW2011_GWF2_39_15]|uniref:Uncharacterized protein n=1 Tax=candidate division WS6 bacterium GW2011_GWF2_39_15 TaxID=1619100 RepID=A0A0G0QX67_9BACT|nr:MAG: hypothetical protein UT34_C0001G0267 [candidate division WS6 bacterium GW2011_GWF2_39_15]